MNAEHHLPRWYQPQQSSLIPSLGPINVDSQINMLEKLHNENIRDPSQEQHELNVSTPLQYQHLSIQENHYTVIDEFRNTSDFQPAQLFRNSTGGFIADGNGVSKDSSDLNVTFLVVSASNIWKSCL